MNRKLYVNNIPWSVTNNDLKTWVQGLGFVVDEVKIIMSAEDGRSRGFGFITFRTEEEASRALWKLDGASYLGRVLHAAVAVPKKPGDRAPESRQPEPGEPEVRGDRSDYAGAWSPEEAKAAKGRRHQRDEHDMDD